MLSLHISRISPGQVYIQHLPECTLIFSLRFCTLNIFFMILYIKKIIIEREILNYNNRLKNKKIWCLFMPKMLMYCNHQKVISGIIIEHLQFMNTLELSLYLKCNIILDTFYFISFILFYISLFYFSGILHLNYALLCNIVIVLFPCTVNERIPLTGNVKHSREPFRSSIRAAGLRWCTSSPRKNMTVSSFSCHVTVLHVTSILFINCLMFSPLRYQLAKISYYMLHVCLTESQSSVR